MIESKIRIKNPSSPLKFVPFRHEGNGTDLRVFNESRSVLPAAFMQRQAAGSTLLLWLKFVPFRQEGE